MPCLNQDILFDIGKQLIENGNSKAVIQFALSGKESFEAMRNVFSSVTILKLYKYGYYIGWGRYETYVGVEALPEFLWNQIGNSVKELYVNCTVSYIAQMYRPFIDKIIDKKQLKTFGAGKFCTKTFLDEFIPEISSTLQNITIPNSKMSENVRNSWALKSLTIVNPHGNYIAYYCCITESLKLLYRDINNDALPDYESLNYHLLSPYLTSVKELIIDDVYFRFHIHQFKNVIKYFPSLESIKYEIKVIPKRFPQGIKPHISYFTNIINESTKVPSKINCFLYNSKKDEKVFDVEKNKETFADFQFDNSDPDLICFRKFIPTADSQSILFEIQFCNKKFV